MIFIPSNSTPHLFIFISQNTFLFLTDYTIRSSVIENAAVISLPGLTVIMVLEVTVADMPLRKLSKLIFASAMKSTWKEKQKLKQQLVILNINTKLHLKYPPSCFSSVECANRT